MQVGVTAAITQLQEIPGDIARVGSQIIPHWENGKSEAQRVKASRKLLADTAG